jgi:hypothetical protein
VLRYPSHAGAVSWSWQTRLRDTKYAANFSLHWTGSSRFSLVQWGCRWRLRSARELWRWT